MKTKKLNSDIVKKLEAKIADEYKASYLYRAIANYLENIGFSKAAGYFAKESKEEMEHSLRIQSFLVGWNVSPKLPKIDIPVMEFDGLKGCIEKAYELELSFYEAYDELAGELLDMDRAVYSFIEYFLDVQTDSVKRYSDMINTLDGVGDEKCDLLLLQDILFG